MVDPTDRKQHSQLHSLLSSATNLRRPLPAHLSADNSWLLSVPISYNSPAASKDIKQRHLKVYFHLLLDAWLTPSSAPFSGALWFQAQHHIEAPAYRSAAVIGLIADIEAAASAGKGLDGRSKAEIDAVLVGQNLPDHMNYDTLKQVDATVPVFAAEAAVPT